MRAQMADNKKSLWDKFQIVAQVMLAVVALMFSVLFSLKQQKNTEATLKLAASNLVVAEAQQKTSEQQLKSALLPSLLSDNPKHRAVAMYLAHALDESFASTVAGVLAVSDPDPSVRKRARETLESLSQSRDPQVRQKVEDSISQYDVANEMRVKGLLKKVDDAQLYLQSGNIQDKEKALQLYRSIVNQLSPLARTRLDQTLLTAAESGYKEGHNDDAIGKYRVLFSYYFEPGLGQ